MGEPSNQTFDELGMPFPLFRAPVSHACIDRAGPCSIDPASTPHHVAAGREQSAVSSLFAPASYLLFVVALASAFNYNTWNMAPYQFVFFATLFMLLYILHTSSREGAVSPLLATLLAVYVVAQVLLIILPMNVHSWHG